MFHDTFRTAPKMKRQNNRQNSLLLYARLSLGMGFVNRLSETISGFWRHQVTPIEGQGQAREEGGGKMNPALALLLVAGGALLSVLPIPSLDSHLLRDDNTYWWW
jgi:hypothetical protein